MSQDVITDIRIFHQRKMLYKSIGIINAIIMVLLMLCTICSVVLSNSWVLAIIQIAALGSLLASAILFHKFILRNKGSIDIWIYGKAGLTFILTLVGTFPICLLTYTYGNPSLIAKYGLFAISTLANMPNLLIPISIIIFVSLCFWLEVVFILNESGLYIKCHELKKTLWE